MNVKESGYVDILTNPSFREDWVKIGKSAHPVDVGSKEQDNTAFPLPLGAFATLKTEKYIESEKLTYQYIERLNYLKNNNHEFFNIKSK